MTSNTAVLNAEAQCKMTYIRSMKYYVLLLYMGLVFATCGTLSDDIIEPTSGNSVRGFVDGEELFFGDGILNIFRLQVNEISNEVDYSALLTLEGAELNVDVMIVAFHLSESLDTLAESSGFISYTLQGDESCDDIYSAKNMINVQATLVDERLSGEVSGFWENSTFDGSQPCEKFFTIKFNNVYVENNL